jgi:hypothetical protein
MVVGQFVLVRRVYVLSADFPEEGVKFVTETIFLHVPEDFDFRGVRHEVAPHIVVDRDDDIASQSFRHAQNIAAGHFIGHTDRVLAVGTKGTSIA